VNKNKQRLGAWRSGVSRPSKETYWSQEKQPKTKGKVDKRGEKNRMIQEKRYGESKKEAGDTSRSYKSQEGIHESVMKVDRRAPTDQNMRRAQGITGENRLTGGES